jgi:hypothetical protein
MKLTRIAILCLIVAGMLSIPKHVSARTPVTPPVPPSAGPGTPNS